MKKYAVYTLGEGNRMVGLVCKANKTVGKAWQLRGIYGTRKQAEQAQDQFLPWND